MAKRNYKYPCTVDLSNLKKSKTGQTYKWGESIGCLIPFDFDNGGLIGEFKLVDYKVPEGLSGKHLFLEYNGELLRPILPSSLIKGSLSVILCDHYIAWNYEIGDHAPGNKRVIIIDKKRERKSDGYLHKFYQIKCLDCGFDGNGHYKRGKYYDKYWIAESDLNRLVSCPCCSSAILVPGINDLLTTCPHLSKYVVDTKEASTLPPNSSKNIIVKCLDCGEEHITTPAKLKHNNGVPCRCKDSVSYPNKFSYYLFRELLNQNEIDYHESEYSPDWADLYKYDNYIIVKDKEYIIEMDGQLGHGKLSFGKGIDIEGKKRDEIKENLAMNHNIELIRINCDKSDADYIKNSLLSSKLKEVVNLKNIDWTKIDKLCVKNVYKEICLDFNDTNKSIKDLSSEYSFAPNTIRSILKKGTEFGWCTYVGNEMKKEETGWVNVTAQKLRAERKTQVLNYCLTHDYYSGPVIEKELGFSMSIAIDIMHELATEGLIEYDRRFANNKRPTIEPIPQKKVAIYDPDGNLMKIYESISECERSSLNDFGIKFYGSQVSAICLGKRYLYKGYHFEHILNE